MMFRLQGTNSRSNGIYCEPDNSHHSHQFSPPLLNTKSSKNRNNRHHHRNNRTSSRSQHVAHMRGADLGLQSEADSSSDLSDGTYADSDSHAGMAMANKLNLNQNGGSDSPPEPAPSDLPLRMNGALRTLKHTYGHGNNDVDGDGEHSYHLQHGSNLYIPPDYLKSSSYQPKSPLPVGSALATAKKLFQSDNPQTETADSNSTLSTLPSQARLIGGVGPPNSNQMQTGIPSAPVILPVFPTSTPHSGQPTGNGAPNSRSLQRNQYSPSRFTLQKDCRVSDRCSWKCVSIALLILCTALISILIYFAIKMGDCSRYPGNGCIVVEDAKVMARGKKHYPVIDLTSISPKSNEAELGSPTTEGPEVTSRIFSELNDGISPVEVVWSQLLTRRIEPYSYWTLEMTMKDSAYVNMNITFPWGSNWALLFRQNALPSITQHDFMKIVKNGRMEATSSREGRRHMKRDTHEKEKAFLGEDNGREIGRSSVTNRSDHNEHHNYLSHSLEEAKYRRKRDNYVDQNVLVFSEFLESGKWFFRLFNDDLLQRQVTLMADYDLNTELRCSRQCNGNGNCLHGKCHCFEGFHGEDCSQSVCPVLCSNHGRYGGGICHCYDNWKGIECNIPESECEDDNCNGHGSCVSGQCICHDGWTGSSCEERNCIDPSCSYHGQCVGGRCLCDPGWAGSLCNIPEELLQKCLPDCSGHGEYNVHTGMCECDKPYSGFNCMEVVCDKECGKNGFCNDEGQCDCLDGWTGDNCEMLRCDARCEKHGQCRNGTCICSLGWNGKHCTLDGCPNSCSHHGSCIIQNGIYSCKCSRGWAGSDCSIRLETDCSDDIDNDEDGKADCSDSECCPSPICRDHLMCMTASDPVEVLLRKQPPSVTSSFFQRVKFLIEENSVQSYAQKDEYSESQFWNSFDPRRVSVIRGQVVSPDGLGIVGIRVSVEKNSQKKNFGFTLTRKGGWFDILVNGGGSVTLQFQRAPFKALTHTVFVPWNEIVVLDSPVVIFVEDKNEEVNYKRLDEFSQQPCHEHNPDLLKPIVMSSWLPGMVGASPERMLVFGETQILQESIVIPGSDVHLVYHSSHSPGYLATILMQLTGEEIPEGLTLVHIRITIEGELYSKVFEADPNITYTFGWKKRNVYQQKVYGLAVARVAVGYEYSTCAKPIWTVQTVTLKGFDVDIANVGGWNLDIHHHYNFHEGILQKGDGSEVHLQDLPRIVSKILGETGQRRQLDCEPCDSLLFEPVALATGPDGSIYVGDFNLIRRITPNNRIYTILQLSATKVAQKYYIAVSPADGHLYVSDPEKYQILKVKSMKDVENLSENWTPVVGNGEKCAPGDPDDCGDGFKGIKAKLSHPKGIAIDKDGIMYIADGANIRVVDKNGVISTFIGSHSRRGAEKVVRTTDFETCRVQRAGRKSLRLYWPSSLALNHVENKLAFIDEGVLFQVTADNQVERVLSCESRKEDIVGPVLDLSFSPKGQLYFITEDSKLYTTKRIGEPSIVRTDKMSPMRNESESKGKERNDNNLDMGLASALSIGADGTIYVADQTHSVIKQISHFIPLPNMNGDYEVIFPATGEIYIFNRYGQHILTKDLKSGKTLYTFLYTKNTSYGKLSKISDSAENKILFLRDYSSIVSTIENTQRKKCSLKINQLGRLVHFQEMENSTIRLEYSDNGLLLAKSTATGLTSSYSYDRFGRIETIIEETGVLTHFEYKLSGPNIEVLVDQSYRKGVVKFVVRSNEEFGHVTVSRLTDDPSHEMVTMKPRTFYSFVKNESIGISTEQGAVMRAVSWGVYPLLQNGKSRKRDLLSSPSYQYVCDATYDRSCSDLSANGIRGNKLEWKFKLRGDAVDHERILNREMWVNNSEVLKMEFDQSLSREVMYNQAHESIFFVQYDKSGLPLYFVPTSTSQHRYSLNVTYDRFNRMENWKWGEGCGLQISYGINGFATRIKDSSGHLIRSIEYNEYGQPSKISLASSRFFKFHYDVHGGLKSVETPSGTHHAFSLQHSIQFTKFVYKPPGHSSMRNGFVKYFNPQKRVQSIRLPSDSGRVVYDYDIVGRPIAILYSEGKISYKYKTTGMSVSSLKEGDFEMTTHTLNNGLNKMVQKKIEFSPKSGFASAKFVYHYDKNFRLTSTKVRIGGNVLGEQKIVYDVKTGRIEQLGSFLISRPSGNESSIFDGMALFTRTKDGYGQLRRYSLTIQAMEAFRMDLSYYSEMRKLRSLNITTKNMSYAPSRNFTYDDDGRLVKVESAEPWKFGYDENGNLINLTYRGNGISLQHNRQDRIVRFGDGWYKYDAVGRVIKNAREECFVYNSMSNLVHVFKPNRFDIKYYYDDLNRLVGRKDNHGNITQFFYSDVTHPTLVTHIYSPRENRLLNLVYDEDQRLIYVQANRNQKYYVATDNCGTPTLIFNHYGHIVREMSRSPYGHIVYDSDPYFYMPIDFCGGIIDKMTSLVHTKDGRVYDPLIGQFLTPDWENILGKVDKLESLHLYRIDGNDPINLDHNPPSFDHQSWLKHMGYNLESLAPQLYPEKIGLKSKDFDIAISGLESRLLEKTFDVSKLGTIQKSAVTKSILIPNPVELLSESEPPLGKHILLTRTKSGKALISCPFCSSNRIYKDVFTQILNGSDFLDYVSHSATQDVFHFAKKELWKASDDLAELEHLSGKINVTVHDQSNENQLIHIKIPLYGAVISIRYGLSGDREKSRLVHHAKNVAGRKAWSKIKELIRDEYPVQNFSANDRDEILKKGHLNSHHFEYTHDPDKFPQFADDPANIHIVVKKSKSSKRRFISHS